MKAVEYRQSNIDEMLDIHHLVSISLEAATEVSEAVDIFYFGISSVTCGRFSSLLILLKISMYV